MHRQAEIMQSVIVDPYLLLPLVTCIIPYMLVFNYVIFTCHIGGSNPRKGDVLVIAGATLYAISNVSEVS